MEESGKTDVIVIGGGAAGLFCALTAGRRGRRVLVLEGAEKIGKKILISGGGRCNFTNLHTAPENFLCENPNFHKSALARFTPYDFIELVDRHRIRYHEKKLGQLFCDESAREIVEMLQRECAAARVEIRINCRVDAVEKTTGFTVRTSQGRFECESLVIATGGLSIPKMGATDFGHRLARQFGLRVTATRPALVPLTLAGPTLAPLLPLSGVSVDSMVRFGAQQFRENILFTHHGLSGPAILQISSYWKPGQPIEIDLLPDDPEDRLLQDERDGLKELKTLLAQHWSQRFAQTWTDLHAHSKPMRQYSPRELRDVAEKLHHWTLLPNGTEGYRKAEVTAGGVDTNELSSKTLGARRVPGLFFIGEVVDVTGWLGGYNFQWAWASGHAAGLAI
ncbi:MAG: NAD(P)/FAD-dependent oxidoreductase [Blastocatellia bacterium]|nr:NAD(P)/FAD-dependent oxidoreductase [Blastocatellia bacterium]